MMDIKNPPGLAGVEFVEFATPDVDYMDDVFLEPGFSRLKKHRTKAITLYQQNDIQFLLNDEVRGSARDSAPGFSDGGSLNGAVWMWRAARSL